MGISIVGLKIHVDVDVGRFEVTITINPWTVQHKVDLKMSFENFFWGKVSVILGYMMNIRRGAPNVCLGHPNILALPF